MTTLCYTSPTSTAEEAWTTAKQKENKKTKKNKKKNYATGKNTHKARQKNLPIRGRKFTLLDAPPPPRGSSCR